MILSIASLVVFCLLPNLGLGLTGFGFRSFVVPTGSRLSSQNFCSFLVFFLPLFFFFAFFLAGGEEKIVTFLASPNTGFFTSGFFWCIASTKVLLSSITWKHVWAKYFATFWCFCCNFCCYWFFFFDSKFAIGLRLKSERILLL